MSPMESRGMCRRAAPLAAYAARRLSLRLCARRSSECLGAVNRSSANSTTAEQNDGQENTHNSPVASLGRLWRALRIAIAASFRKISCRGFLAGHATDASSAETCRPA